MSQMDIQWNKIAKQILEKGWDEDPSKVRAVYASDKEPAPTRYIIDARMEFDGTEAPIQRGKKVKLEKPLGEIEWIMIDKSNRLEDLHAKDIHFWDNWEQKDEHGEGNGTIGEAYGAVMNRKIYPYPVKLLRKEYLDPRKQLTYMINDNSYVMLDQMDYLIQNLLHSPNSRRHIISLWDLDNLPKMKLPPCVWRSEWMVDGDDKLNLKVGARSQDFCLGNPFNVIQYYALQRMIAQVVDLEPGKMIFDMGNVHIYDRHFEGAQKIIDRNAVEGKSQLILPKGIRNLYEFNMGDITLENYNPEGHVPFEIAE